MKIKQKLKKYGNTAVIRLRKEELERLAEEGIKIGSWIDVEISKDKTLNAKDQRRLD